MCRVNRRFRDRFVPVTLAALTMNGTVPVNQFRQLTFALQVENFNNLLLMQVPWPVRENVCAERSKFWESLSW